MKGSPREDHGEVEHDGGGVINERGHVLAEETLREGKEENVGLMTRKGCVEREGARRRIRGRSRTKSGTTSCTINPGEQF